MSTDSRFSALHEARKDCLQDMKLMGYKHKPEQFPVHTTGKYGNRLGEVWLHQHMLCVVMYYKYKDDQWGWAPVKCIAYPVEIKL